MDILDKKRMEAARAIGICFLCTTCKHWYEGEDMGLKDDMREPRCSKSNCFGPVWGGSFTQYNGLLETYKHKFCYLCGANATHHVWAKGESGKVGVCKEHVPTVKKYTAREIKEGHAVMVSERRAGPDRYEVGQ